MKHFLIITAITILPFAIGITVSFNMDTVKNESKDFSAYPEHIAGAFTGGFGEQSCHSCHFDYDLNQPEGEVTFSGIEDKYKPGKEYTLHIQVKREDLKRAGFQMTTRFQDGSQAGKFVVSAELTTTPNIDNPVTYLQHGVGKVEAENGEKNWQITWTAPERKQPVLFNIAANAANGDESAFGDWIYLKEIKVEPIP